MLPSDYIKKNKLVSLSNNCLQMIDKLSNDERLGYIEDNAYILATIKHETANTFAPIAEYGLGKGCPYGKPDEITKQVYYGRGYVQITWKNNYEKFSHLLGIDLINNPNLAMEPNNAYEIMVIGMIDGLFTGKKLNDYINDNIIDYVNARKIINGLDKAQLIAGYAKEFENLLDKVYQNV